MSFVTSFSVTFVVCPSTVLFRITLILSGRFPSWLFPSSHDFTPAILTFSGVRVFFRLYPSFDFVYPGTSSSSILYVISFPFSCFGRLLNSYFQFPSASALTSFSTTVVVVPSTVFFRITLILSGRFPSWLFASSHVFLPAISIFVILAFVAVQNNTSPSTTFTSFSVGSSI